MHTTTEIYSDIFVHRSFRHSFEADSDFGAGLTEEDAYTYCLTNSFFFRKVLPIWLDASEDFKHLRTGSVRVRVTTVKSFSYRTKRHQYQFKFLLAVLIALLQSHTFVSFYFIYMQIERIELWRLRTNSIKYSQSVKFLATTRSSVAVWGKTYDSVL